MESKRYNFLAQLSFLLVLTFTNIFDTISANTNQAETYIVTLESPNGVVFDKPEDRHDWYNSFLFAATIDSNEKPSIIHAYYNVFTGFAANLSANQVKAMENMEGFVSARREMVYNFHTTHTPIFLGLHQNLGFWRGSNFGKGIIIGLVDSGITPNHPSFDDKGVPPPPKKWKGKCEVAGCNNKLIGARDFPNSGPSGSPLDTQGHGTHTSSTAAGNFVDGANVFGMAKGTAAGVAPLAHVAMYKCGDTGCTASAIIAAMDAAVEDGVDVLSMSIGGGSVPFYDDVIAIPAFSAIQKGIFVTTSAGNSGPDISSLANEAPWLLTVGASTVDRNIRATVQLGNMEFFEGESLYQPKDFPPKFFPLVYPGTCGKGSLNNTDVKGKVVICDLGDEYWTRLERGQTVKDAGGVAMILVNDLVTYGSTTRVDPHVLPASHVGYEDGIAIKRYLLSTSSPVATIIFRGTVIGVDTAPEVASFSSRGPSLASPGIIKPDIIGPGVNILAAWPVSIENTTRAKSTFNMISGTSMACPHLAGVSALLKSEHPHWSPAAIKSAIMTTATQASLNGQPIKDGRELSADVFAIGSGHVNPSKANDPGLIFDIQPNDYIPYLCGLGYSSKQVGIIVQKRVSCSKVIQEAQLNYPSYAFTLKAGEEKVFSRTVTNVGEANSTYTIIADSIPPGIYSSVDTKELKFTNVNQKLTYDVYFKRDEKYKVESEYVEGFITWGSGKYEVRTPFSIQFV